MVVIFLQTTAQGQREVGRIVQDEAGAPVIDAAVSALADWLFRDVDRTDAAAVQSALRRAPSVFDGAYLRAVVGAAGKFNPNHAADGRFASASGGGFAFAPDTGAGAGGAGSGGTAGFSPTDTRQLLQYGANRLSPPQFTEFARALTGERVTPETLAFWRGKAAEWLEWLQEDPSLLDFTEPQPLNGATLTAALEAVR
jgi:hypothetical protein